MIVSIAAVVLLGFLLTTITGTGQQAFVCPHCHTRFSSHLALHGHLANREKTLDGSCNGLSRRAKRHRDFSPGTQGASTSYAANLTDSQRLVDLQTRALLQRQLEIDVAERDKASKEDAERKRLLEEAHPKDGDRELFSMVERMNQGRGLSDTDKLELLRFLDRTYANPSAHGLEGKPVTMKNLHDYKKYKAERMSKQNITGKGWSSSEITVDHNDVPELQDIVISQRFWHKDFEDFLTSQFGNPDYVGHFVLDAQEQHNNTGQRVFEDPQDADLWLHFQEVLRRREGHENAKVAALQLYSDKTLLTISDNLSAHPIRATLLNIAFGKRVQNLCDVGYLPDIKPPPGTSFLPEVWRKVKLTFMSKCLTHLLKSAKEASFHGIRLKDPEGKEHLVFPRLFSYVVDDPESKDVTCIKGGNTAYPCELCWVPNDQLNNVTLKFADRTEKQQEAIFNQLMEASTKGDRDRLSSTMSTHPVASGIWGFHDCCDGYGSSTLCVAYDTMHNEDLGVFLYLVKGISERVGALGGGLLQSLNERMHMMPRADDFQIPYASGKYFPDHSRIQAKEHRNVMQILPHILHGIDEECCDLACRFVKLYMERHRKDRPMTITEADLIRMDELLVDFDGHFQQVVASTMPSGGATIKYHKQVHMTQLIRRLGNTRHFNAQFFEAGHHKTKLFYAGTSKKKHNEQYLAEMALKDNVLRLAKELDECDVSVPARQHRSAYVLAAGLGRHVFNLGGEKIGLGVLDNSYKGYFLHPQQLRKATLLLQQQPEIALLPRLLATFLDAPISSHMDLITVYKTAALASTLPYAQDTLVLQVVHASSNFHGKPWYDNVCVKGEGQELWYAQLRLMFSYGGKDLALVRWYDLQPGMDDDVLVQHGCQQLAWAVQGEGRRSAPWYSVIAMESILRREYIVRDFSAAQRTQASEMFHVSCFKWSRPPTDRKGITV